MKDLFTSCFLVYNSSKRRLELYDKRDNGKELWSYDKMIMSFPIDSIEVPWIDYKYEIQEKSGCDLIVNYDGEIKDYRDY